MALLEILVYPDPRLRTRALPVESVDDEIRKLVDDMAETMYAAPGIGLAAIQVDVPKRVIVIDTSPERNDLKTLINPEIRKFSGAQEMEEGCLSVPGVYAPVTRADRIVVSALDRDGKSYEMEAEGLLAVCIQHEIDHLDGKVFVDYLSRIKQDRIRKRMKKHVRQRSEPALAQAVL